MLLCLARATNRNLYDFWHIDCSTSFKLESKCKRQMLTGKPMEESANSWIFPAFCIVCPSQRIFNKDGSNSLPETNSSPLKMSHPKRKRSSSYHFQVLLLLVSGRVGVGNHEESCDVWKCHHTRRPQKKLVVTQRCEKSWSIDTIDPIWLTNEKCRKPLVCIYIYLFFFWSTPPPSNSGKWRFIGMPY